MQMVTFSSQATKSGSASLIPGADGTESRQTQSYKSVFVAWV